MELKSVRSRSLVSSRSSHTKLVTRTPTTVARSTKKQTITVIPTRLESGKSGVNAVDIFSVGTASKFVTATISTVKNSQDKKYKINVSGQDSDKVYSPEDTEDSSRLRGPLEDRKRLVGQWQVVCIELKDTSSQPESVGSLLLTKKPHEGVRVSWYRGQLERISPPTPSQECSMVTLDPGQVREMRRISPKEQFVTNVNPH